MPHYWTGWAIKSSQNVHILKRKRLGILRNGSCQMRFLSNRSVVCRLSKFFLFGQNYKFVKYFVKCVEPKGDYV